MTQVELLAPARDLDGGRAAIDSGADAVYIGAPRFGARARAGNSMEDIRRLLDHAHTYWARVYVTVNTLLYDEELPEAVALLHALYEIGVDAAIIQDVGLLECELPPLPLIASTQMHNHTPERVAFLEQVGIRRAILARELSLEQIRAIRARTTLELESFVHGALCVGYSGQCYLSYAIGGRSGNRGECAQPCRRRYSLVAGRGDAERTLVADRYLLSLRDLSLTGHLDEMLDAGVTSFKIEGRLKDRAYVVNVVSWYRRELDRLLALRGWQRSSSGKSQSGFEPDLAKTFNRGYTTYLIRGRAEPPGAIDTPKMAGEVVGRVTAVERGSFVLTTGLELVGGDGLCWFDAEHELCGTVVNAAQPVPGRPGQVRVMPDKMAGIRSGLQVYRNHDQAFLRQVERSRPVRTIGVRLRLAARSSDRELVLHAIDEDGNRATAGAAGEWPAPHEGKADQAAEAARRQLSRMGNTQFECTAVDLAWEQPLFIPVAELNALRRRVLEQLSAARAVNRPVLRVQIVSNDAPFPEPSLSYRGNVLNQKAVAFYRRHGVQEIEPAAEAGLDLRGRVVMRSRYCLRHQLGLCDGHGGRRDGAQGPWALVDDEGHRYPLRFDCAACEMEVLY